MRSFITAILCLTLVGFASAQTGSSTAPKSTVTKPAAAKPATATTAASTAPVQAVFETTLGNITCTLFPDKAPITVDNFIGLATGKKDWKNPASGATMHSKPLYDGTVFHRVIPNFMIQGGDPLGNGSGGPGYSFRDEQSDLTFDQPGRLAMANSGANTNGSQFFITEVPTPHLNGHYNLFGQCDNIDLVKQIARLSTDPRNDRPFNPPKITHVKIIDPRHPAGTAPHKATTGTAAHKSTTGTTTPKKSTPPPTPQ
jgi:peptidyl-prolyl cis-trans isomerase A (cyclophilin A)